MRVAITGGTGFLGKVSAYYLQRHGYDVLAIGRNEAIGRELNQAGIRFIKQDISQKDGLYEALDGYDNIVHCAALSSLWGAKADFHRANVAGTENVIQAAQQLRVRRFIHISSPSIYASRGLSGDLNIKETAPLPEASINSYAWSKKLAEMAIDQAAAAGLPTITLRPQAIFGPEDPGIMPRLIKANQRRGIPIFSKNSPLIDITYVENVAHAIYCALMAPSLSLGKSYNITNDAPVKLHPFLQGVFQELGLSYRELRLPYSAAAALTFALEVFHKVFLPHKEPILTSYSLAVLSQSRTLDITAAKRDLGYQPITSVEDGVKAYIHWWRKKNHAK